MSKEMRKYIDTFKQRLTESENMKHLKYMNESIDKLKTYHVGGVSPEYKLMEKINELIDVINKLEKRVKELESK